MTTSMPADPMAIRVSDMISRLYLDRFGKGPLRAETVICGDLVVTLLGGVSTLAERGMIEAGKQDSVLATRMLWQQSTNLLFKAGVTRVTGREVLVAISGYELDHDMASEVSVLAPLSDHVHNPVSAAIRFIRQAPDPRRPAEGGSHRA